MTSNQSILEERVTVLERMVADLKQKVDRPAAKNWLDKVVGSISDDEAFLKALEYGRELRRADVPTDETDEKL